MSTRLQVTATPSEDTPQPARNEPCPCGTEIKYKNCCGMLNLTIPDRPDALDLEAEFLQAQEALNKNDATSAKKFCISLLNQLPGHVRALQMLYNIYRQENNRTAAEVLIRRVVQLLPQNEWPASELSLMLYERGEQREAEQHARNVVRLAPNNAQGHNLMGMILTDTNRLQAGEFHYRKALELHGPIGKLCANLGFNLKGQGKVVEADKLYQQAVELEPDNTASIMGWIKLKEANRQIDDAWDLLKKLEVNIPEGSVNLCMTRAVLHRREKNLDDALAALNKAKPDETSQNAAYHYEKGEVLDKLGRYDEAFASFSKANQTILEFGKKKYGEQQSLDMANRLKAFFNRDRVNQLPKGQRGEHEKATPIFIVGYPRSGTTMVEQIMSSLDGVSAGDELHFMWNIVGAAPKMLNSSLFYPECFADLWFGDNQAALETFRDFYLKNVYQLGILEDDTKFFTDKMPLNETNLGMISLIFPEAPVVHLIRHPLDVVLSNYFNDLTHGNCQSYDLTTSATHYALIRDLLDHYLKEMDINYLPVRYEDIVQNPEMKCREITDFIGLEWDDKCLDFHKNKRYARTASYAQVTENLYDSSVFRHLNYVDHIQEILPILEPAIKRLGYAMPEN